MGPLVVPLMTSVKRAIPFRETQVECELKQYCEKALQGKLTSHHPKHSRRERRLLGDTILRPRVLRHDGVVQREGKRDPHCPAQSSPRCKYNFLPACPQANMFVDGEEREHKAEANDVDQHVEQKEVSPVLPAVVRDRTVRTQSQMHKMCTNPAHNSPRPEPLSVRAGRRQHIAKDDPTQCKDDRVEQVLEQAPERVHHLPVADHAAAKSFGRYSAHHA